MEFFKQHILTFLIFFQTISKQILFQTEALPEGVQVKFFSKCQGYKDF